MSNYGDSPQCSPRAGHTGGNGQPYNSSEGPPGPYPANSNPRMSKNFGCPPQQTGGSVQGQQALVLGPATQEFCIKLTMASVQGRPVSLTLARFDDFDNPLIGCSQGFLDISGLPRQCILGKNCRFLNTGLNFPQREHLRECIRSGVPFLGVLHNMRHLGEGEFETFQNLLHLVLVVAGTRRYILGFQADVTGLSLDLTDGSLDALRLQKMFDAVLGAQCDQWIHFQEGMFHAPPLYLYIRYGAGSDEVYIKEEQADGKGPAFEAPDQCMVLAPRFPATVPDESLKWRFLLLGGHEAGGYPKQADCGLPARPKISLSNALPVDDTPMEAFKSNCAALNPESSNWMSTMKNQLRALNMEDPANVLSARGISKLGMSSAAKIRTHFSRYGEVKAVHVPLVFKKRSKEPRSAGKCFIVMDSMTTAERILRQGLTHVVEGVSISVERFSPASGAGDDK